MLEQMALFLSEVQKTTLADLEQNHNSDHLFRNTIEELGEFAKALTVEQGLKNKDLTETSTQEAVDVVICALALFYSSGGTDKMLADYGMVKLAKWKARLKPN
jgi:NTP pyrophosphatase (non-canonical NTP hydrolase)